MDNHSHLIINAEDVKRMSLCMKSINEQYAMYYNKKKAAKTSDDYILAGRSAPLIMVVGSYFATSVSTGSLVGYAGMGYSNGISGYWNAASFMIATMWIGAWIIPRLRRSGVTTIPELFEKYYPGQGRMIADFWMPNKSWKGCDVNDPSARVLSNYGDSGK